jgi:rod shape determining protein RodA
MNNFFTFLFSRTDTQLFIFLLIILFFSLNLIGQAVGFDSSFFFKQLLFICWPHHFYTGKHFKSKIFI